MNTRFAPRLRLCGIVMLALAFSPLTAPFSTLALSDLFSDPTSHDGAVVVQLKYSTEKPTASAAAVQVPLGPVTVTRAPLPHAVPFTSLRVTHDLPLRI